VLTFSY